jgi:hypothetical protein
LERIEQFGFSGSRLDSIVIPSSVWILGQFAFSLCPSLKTVRFETTSRLSRIEDSVFAESGLKSIAIPSSVVVLGDSCFSCCCYLEGVAFEPDSKLQQTGGWTFSLCADPSQWKDSFRPFPGQSYTGRYGMSRDRLRSVAIPPAISILGQFCFCDRLALESIVFLGLSQLSRIEESAFQKTGLKSIQIPASVSLIGKSSFHDCRSLTTVTFESVSRLDIIEDFAFSGSGLSEIIIPSSRCVPKRHRPSKNRSIRHSNCRGPSFRKVLRCHAPRLATRRTLTPGLGSRPGSTFSTPSSTEGIPLPSNIAQTSAELEHSISQNRLGYPDHVLFETSFRGVLSSLF